VQSYVHCKRYRHAHDKAIESTQRQSDRDLPVVKAWTVVNALVTPDTATNALEAFLVRVRFSSQLAVVFELDKGSVESFQTCTTFRKIVAVPALANVASSFESLIGDSLTLCREENTINHSDESIGFIKI